MDIYIKKTIGASSPTDPYCNWCQFKTHTYCQLFHNISRKGMRVPECIESTTEKECECKNLKVSNSRVDKEKLKLILKNKMNRRRNEDCFVDTEETEAVWIPKDGEDVEVRDDVDDVWILRKSKGYVDRFNCLVCYSHYAHADYTVPWEYWRKPQ